MGKITQEDAVFAIFKSDTSLIDQFEELRKSLSEKQWNTLCKMLLEFPKGISNCSTVMYQMSSTIQQLKEMASNVEVDLSGVESEDPYVIRAKDTIRQMQILEIKDYNV
jgi:peptidoglycan hydrolase CwlO-like protein